METTRPKPPVSTAPARPEWGENPSVGLSESGFEFPTEWREELRYVYSLAMIAIIVGCAFGFVAGVLVARG